MKTSSAKAKGRRLQDRVVARLMFYFRSLREGDVKPAIMGESGEDIKLSPAAADLIPLSFECKNTERLNLWAALKQTAANAPEGRIPVVVFSRNREKDYIALPFEDFLRILHDGAKVRAQTTD